MKSVIKVLFVVLSFLSINQKLLAQIDVSALPRTIYCETQDNVNGHVQGVAVDLKNGHVYFSFTTCLVKTDLKGNVLGSVTGLTCHLGCIDFDSESGLLYGSAEYKDDAIGKGIMKRIGKDLGNRKNAFYIAIFDTRKINRLGIDAETSGIMQTAYLKDVVNHYETKVNKNGQEVAHRYGCSGIDGVALGPQFGKKGGKKILNVAYGIFGDIKRSDNDYQVILQYDLSALQKTARSFYASRPHQNGPKKPKKTYFVYTGNTEYGVQNLEYDAFKNYWFMMVYKGKKTEFPNYPVYAIDGSCKPYKQILKGIVPQEKGWVVDLAKDGTLDASSGIYGWPQKEPKGIGSTGIESLGNGYFYISLNGKNPSGRQNCKLTLFRWTGDAKNPFMEVK